MTVINQVKEKKSFIQKMFQIRKEKDGRKIMGDQVESCGEEAQPSSVVEDLLSDNIESPMPNDQHVQTLRVFVATWNVGGKSPRGGLNLDDFLQVNDQSDIYVLGFQEIVPLNAGNVLVIEDNEPAARWLALINQSLNKLDDVALRRLKSSSLFFQKPSLRKISKSFRTESKRKLKSCNCTAEFERKSSRDFCFRCPQSYMSEDDFSSDEDEDAADGSDFVDFPTPTSTNQINYSLIASKQMVGIFVTIWARKELVQHVGHLRISCISRGIMGCLGNKGCISVRMTIYQTSFCFVCSHLASGEKEGDELRRNLDVIEILRNTQFSRICRTLNNNVPDKILEHDRIIWLGDLNYRIALSYQDARNLLEKNNWDALLDKDQLKMEREAGRVFKGWKEGRIYFAPTYKYSYNSDSYAGEASKPKKRRTPAWCDRILWRGTGIQQLTYVRGESRFSDHRPVCAKFLVDVMVGETTKRGLNTYMKVGAEELMSPSSYCVLINPIYEDILGSLYVVSCVKSACKTLPKDSQNQNSFNTIIDISVDDHVLRFSA